MVKAQSFEAAVVAGAQGDGKDAEARREAFDHFPAGGRSQEVWKMEEKEQKWTKVDYRTQHQNTII